MRQYIQYPIIIIAIVVMSIFLPKVYKSLFAKRATEIKINYSPVSQSFIKMTIRKGESKKKIYSTMDEKYLYSKEEYMQMLPFHYFGSLVKINKMPVAFDSYSRNPGRVKKEMRFVRISPKSISKKEIGIYPLFESKPRYSGVSLPKDMFRIGEKGITFIKPETNRIDQEKSMQFTQAFLDAGAVFPLVKIFGNPTPRKPFDEGYFLTDANGALYHLKMIEAKPMVKKIETSGIPVRYMKAKEEINREYYGVVIADDGQVYLLMYNDYRLQKLPISGYDYRSMVFSMVSTPVNRMITIKHTDYQKKIKTINTVVTDTKYAKIAQTDYSYDIKGEPLYEKVQEWLFPYTVQIKRGEKYYATFGLKRIHGAAFVLSVLLSLMYLLSLWKRKSITTESLVQALLIAAGGLYALIPLFAFGQLFNTKKEA